jgi:DNA helicase HerA-like ATPase
VAEAPPLLIARGDPAAGGFDCLLLPAMACRHGLIAGATGTGKTVTLQTIAEGFSRLGVPVLLADVKGDLAGLARPGQEKPAFRERRRLLGLEPPPSEAFPVEFWDVHGELGHPLRSTISELGPLLLARLLDLTAIQSGLLSLAFRVADDQGLLLLDLKDLRALLRHLGEHAREFQLEYGSISAASVGAIQRALLALEEQGAASFFGEPALDFADLLRTVPDGRGVVNVLAAERLIQAPRLYATVLLWLLSELHEELPEVGDLEKPRLVLILDEAHLLFQDAPAVLLEKVEQVVRLIRSKGVAVLFCSQNPMDLPARVLGQLGNRVQHALRAYTPLERKAVRAAAASFRPNPALNVEQALAELGIGEALVSCLDAEGRPQIVQRAFVLPPVSQVGAIDASSRQALIAASPLEARYRQSQDRESAYERLARRAEPAEPPVPAARSRELEREQARQAREAERAARQRDRLLISLAGDAGQALGGRTGRTLARGLLGGLLSRRS